MTDNRSTLPATHSALADRVVDRLFQRLAAIYGRQWLDLWHGVPMPLVKDEWTLRLAAFIPDVIGRALEAITNDSKFPPNLNEFLAACHRCQPKGTPNLYLAGPKTRAPDGAFQSLRSILRNAQK